MSNYCISIIMKHIGISITELDHYYWFVRWGTPYKLGTIICNKDAILRHSLKEPFRATVDIGGHRFFPLSDERVLL